MLEALHGSGGGGRIHAEASGEFLHRPVVAAGEEIERVHLTLLQRLLATEQIRAQSRRPGAAAELDPGATDPSGVFPIGTVPEVDRTGSAGSSTHVRLYGSDP